MRRPFFGIGSDRLRTAAVALYVLAEVVYLAWRTGFTLQDTPTLYGVAFLLAEAWIIVHATWFYVLLRHLPRRREPPPPVGELTVDVLITTYNEDIALVRATAVAARDMDHPHRTIICDDGHRLEMQELAREIGVGYLSRRTNEHYKAGNLNNALAHSNGDLVMVLDADHVPRRHMLARMVGYFAQPDVALVQTPQVYYNVDSFQHQTSDDRRILWHEGAIFQHRIMSGADRMGSTFFIGTGGVVRRSALMEIGGFATGSVTEDILTSLRLHAAGYRSVFVNEGLGVMQAPQSAHAYARQRLRWAQGGLQILRRQNPLTLRGLSLRQRIAYFLALSSSLSCLPNLLFYFAPALYLLFRINPITVEPGIVIPVIAANVVLNQLIYALLASPDGRVFESEFFKFINLPIHLRAAGRLIVPDGLEFRVTPKGRQLAVPLFMLFPAVGLILFNAYAVAVGIEHVAAGYLNAGAATLSLAFATSFVCLGFLVVRRLVKLAGEHEVASVPLDLQARVLHGEQSRWRHVRVIRLGAGSGAIETEAKLERGETVAIDLERAGLERPVSAEVAAVQPNRSRGGYRARLTFEELEGFERDTLGRFLFNSALPTFIRRFVTAPDVLRPDPLAVATAVGSLPEGTSSRLRLSADAARGGSGGLPGSSADLPSAGPPPAGVLRRRAPTDEAHTPAPEATALLTGLSTE